MRLRVLVFLLVAMAPLAACPAAEDEERYFAVFLDGKKIGHGILSRREEGGQVVSREEYHLFLTRQKVALAVGILQTSIETPDGKPLGFSLVQDMGIREQRVEGSVGKDGTLTVVSTSGGQSRRETKPWPEGAVLALGEQLMWRKKGLAEGTRYAITTFDPSSQTAMQGRVRVGKRQEVNLLGRVAELVEIATTLPGDNSSVELLSYVDERYEVQKMVFPMLGMKMEMVACGRQFARSRDDSYDFFDKLTLACPASLDEAGTAREITFLLLPAEGAKPVIPSTDSQSVRVEKDGRIRVTVRSLEVRANEKYPYRGRDAAAREALKPSRQVQSDSPKILSLARQAASQAPDAAAATSRIEAFVRSYIRKKDLSVGYATALEVAASRQGDCTEHAVLSAALCRAMGIPARVVSGLVYADRSGSRRHVFLPHEWVEAYVGGQWIGLDAAQPGWDPRRIALSFGDGNDADSLDFVSSLGFFRIEKVSFRK